MYVCVCVCVCVHMQLGVEELKCVQGGRIISRFRCHSLLPSKELTVLEDITQTSHTVNPLLVHVEVLGEGVGQRLNPLQRTSSLEQVQYMCIYVYMYVYMCK